MDVNEIATEREEDLLNDAGELDGADSPIRSDDSDILDDFGGLVESAAVDADPVHLARCVECAESVRYRSNVTGTGFFLVDEAPDQAYGIGPNGRPICRNGHGEMEVADDKLPAADAFSEVAAMQQAQQRSLPGIFKPFNFESVFKEIVEQAQCVERLKSEHDAAKEEAASAKKNLDKGAELLMRMTLEFERRRKEKPDAENATATDRQLCTWEQKHDGSICPVCSMEFSQNVIVRLIGRDVAAPDAVAHVADVDALLVAEDIANTVDELEAVNVYVDTAVIAGWPETDRKAVREYAAFRLTFENALAAGEPEPEMTVTVEKPDILGTPHIPAAVLPGEHQVCSLCEEVIRPASAELEPFKETDYVGVDCRRKPMPEAPRYPETKAKKKAAAAKKIVSQPKPKAAKKKR